MRTVQEVLSALAQATPPSPLRFDLRVATPPDQFDRSIDTIEDLVAAVGSAIEHPFQIQPANGLNVKVKFGTVNDITPTGVDTNILLSADFQSDIYLRLTLDVSGEITAAIVAAAGVIPADTDEYAHILLGQAITSSTAVASVSQAVTHSLRFRTCDRTDDGGTPPAVQNRGSYFFWGV